jgi:cytochrome c-type biogenesis protein CcmH
MLLWLLIALMTGGAILAVLWPLARGRERIAASADLAVYRDQLAEIERDRTRGLLAGTEAEGARIEVSRRLIAAADAKESGSTQSTLDRRRVVSLLALIGIPVVAGVLYVSFGSPDLPGAPLAARLDKPPELQDVGVLLRRVEAHLKQNPGDGRGWEVIAPVYASLGRHEEAANARGEALRLLGASADREADYGEALVAAARGGIDQEARAAFERAAKLDPAHAKARFFLGLAAVQEGRRDDALKIWREVAALGGADNPWQIAATRALKRFGESQ